MCKCIHNISCASGYDAFYKKPDCDNCVIIDGSSSLIL